MAEEVTKQEIKRPKKQFAVWETDGDSGYYFMYESLGDAVSSYGHPVEVFLIEPKSMGEYKTYTRATKLRREKK